MPAPRKYPQELRERAVRLARESDRPLAQIAKDLGVHREALRTWVRQDEADRGERVDRLSTVDVRSWRGCARRTQNLSVPTKSLKLRVRFSPRSSTVPGRSDHRDRRVG